MDGMDGSVEASFGVLDLLLLAVENLKLLIGLPAVVGVMVYAATFLIPREHVSHAILALPASATMVGGAAATATFAQTPNQAAALMVSAVVLDPVIESMGLVGDRSLPEVRLALADDVDANIGADGFLHLLVTRKDPREALVISNAIIDSWLKTTLPLESERLELSERLAFSKESLGSVGRLLRNLADDNGATLGKPLTKGDAGATIVSIGQLQSQYLNDVLVLPRALRGITRDVVKQRPTLVVAGGRESSRGVIAASAAVSVGIVLLVWILVRRAWAIAAQDPGLAAKQRRLLEAWPFRGRRS